mgnify:CR=1 FL=1|jgi:hypothetical protein
MARTRRKQPKSNENSRLIETSPFFKFGEVSIFPTQPKMPRNSPVANIGTVFAINNITTGDVGFSPEPAGKGGPRNRADRESHVLKATQIANLVASTRHAALIGLPFTRMITIHWEAAGVLLADMVKATGRYIDLLSKALARHGSATAWLWVHENGDGKGGHCHLLAHVPARLVQIVTRLQKGWLRKITGKPYKAGVIHSRPIGRRLGVEVGNPALHAANLETVLHYVLKEASLESIVRFRLSRYEFGGCVIGKRCATSQNIGRKARLQLREG